MEILLIRHADYKERSLTKKGRRQARALATNLSKKSLSEIYVSPLVRTQETMSYTANMMNIRSKTLNWLKEIEVPPIHGYAGWELPGVYILEKSKLPNLKSWKKEELVGKKFFQVYKKISKGFDEIISSHGYEKSGHLYKISNSSNEKLAFFSHKGTILTLLSYLLHWPLQLIFVHCTILPTGVTKLIWKEFDGKWASPELKVFNGLSHLKTN